MGKILYLIAKFMPFLKTGDVNLLNKFLSERGGYIVQNAPQSEVQRLISLGANATPNRVLHTSDAIIASTAIMDNVPLLTRDKRLQKYLRAFGFLVEGF